MKNEKQDKKENMNSANKQKEIKYFYTIEDFPKFKILEENYQAILDELLTVINKEKQINLEEKEKLEKTNFDSDEIYDETEASFINIDKNSIKIQTKNKIINDNNSSINIHPQNNNDNLEKYLYTNKIPTTDNSNNLNNINHNNTNQKELNSNNKTTKNTFNIYSSTDLINNLEKSNKTINNTNNNNNNNFNNKNNNNDNKQTNDLTLLKTHQQNFPNTHNLKTFEPWVEKNLYQESNEDGWDVAPLMIGGERIPERWGKFPLLTSLVSQISGVVSVSFSLLKPGTHIVPHKGYDDYSEKMFRFHMGLLVPKGDIAIRVEKEIRKWENSKSFVFDDFMIHEAWNFTAQNRIVLIIDFLKDESKVPEGIKFFDANFNKSVKGYFKKEACDCEGKENDFDLYDGVDDSDCDNSNNGDSCEKGDDKIN